MDTPTALAPAAPRWSESRSELIRRTVCPKGIPEDDFLLFLEQCKRSELDPLTKQAFCVGRRFNAGTRERPVWTTKYEFQPSEAGMLARACRMPDFEGIQASAVFAEDDITMDTGKGEVVHRFNPTKRKGALHGAWARVQLKGRVPVLVWVDFKAYVQPTPLWDKMPTTMIEKVARVAALRKAYPEAFGGLYVREELPPDVAGEVVEVRTVDAQPVDAERPALPAMTTLPAAPVETGRVEVPRAELHRRAALAQSSPARVGPWLVAQGPCAGRPIADLTDQELQATVDLYNEKLQAHPKAKWAVQVRDNLALLEAEVAVRFDQPEPGGQG